MASPQPTDSHTRISNELYTQILMRDFTKRQRAILDLIIRLSYGCGKKYAHIPMLKHFSVCGVKKNKITDELNALKEMSVIDWDNFTCEYWLIKDYDKWKLKQPSNDTQELFSELLRLNLRDTQNGNSSSQNGNQSSQKGNSPVPETGTEKFPKGELECSRNPIVPTAEEVPITKDNYKEIEKINISKADDVDTTCRLVDQTMSECLRKVFIAKRDDYMNIKNLLASGVTANVIEQGIRQSFNRNPNVRSFSYCVPIIKELWEIELAKQAPAELIAFTPKRTQLSALDEFKRRKGITDDDRQRDREIVLNLDGSISET